MYSKIVSWDFTKEANNEDVPDDELTKSDVYIYPALYPLSKVKTAVALVSKWSTTYSGGGREEEYANFIMINDDGTYQPAFKNIPFSSREMIKACFTEDITNNPPSLWDAHNVVRIIISRPQRSGLLTQNVIVQTSSLKWIFYRKSSSGSGSLAKNLL